MRLKVKFLALLIASASSLAAQAQTQSNELLVNPLTCGSALGQMRIEIRHGGGSIFTRGVHYTTALSFDRPGEFSVSSNWGVDLKNETVNANAMTDQYSYGLLQHLALHTNANTKCTEAPDDCGISILNLIETVSAAAAQTRASGAARTREARALECARSIAMSMLSRAYAKSDFDKKLPVRQLSFSDATSVMNRIQAARSAQDAEMAATSAAVSSASASVSSMSASVK